MSQLAKFFDLLGEETKLRILVLLADSGQELCVCELVDSLQEKQYNVSKHLRELLKAKLISHRREGRWVYYRVEKNNRLLQDTLKLIQRYLQSQAVLADQQRMKRRLGLRQNGKCLLGILGKTF
ncbi:MAG: hypothetical protein A2142_08160 [candidate division Zixibacteria bacterium RBG_16_48_11]|nr:MAG: hypothetical protein A2142_08160 [candidate division Zixibacteria bacterium RBG_16_48_11]